MRSYFVTYLQNDEAEAKLTKQTYTTDKLLCQLTGTNCHTSFN